MKFSISIPQFDTDGFDAAGLRSYLIRAEELGFEGGWVMSATADSKLGLRPAAAVTNSKPSASTARRSSAASPKAWN